MEMTVGKKHGELESQEKGRSDSEKRKGWKMDRER